MVLLFCDLLIKDSVDPYVINLQIQISHYNQEVRSKKRRALISI